MTAFIISAVILMALICMATVNACLRDKRYIHSFAASVGGIACVVAVVGMAAA